MSDLDSSNKKFQIFISSTYSDLIEERRAVTESILGMNHIPVGMELFEASNEDQWTYIKNRIREIDYYIVIVAERYGSMGPDGISYTEMEYRFALESNIPIAAFLLHDSQRSNWPRDKVDFPNHEKINQFRLLCEQKVVAYWHDSGSLSSKCQLALGGLIRRYKRPGWVSGDLAVSPSVLSELARLSKENADLRELVSRYDASFGENSTMQKAINHITTSIGELILLYSPIVKFSIPEENFLDKDINNLTILQIFSNRVSDFYGTFDLSSLIQRSISEILSHRPLSNAQKWFRQLGEFLESLLQIWGIVESSRVQYQNGTAPYFKLSDLGSRVFDGSLMKYRKEI